MTMLSQTEQLMIGAPYCSIAGKSLSITETPSWQEQLRLAGWKVISLL